MDGGFSIRRVWWGGRDIGGRFVECFDGEKGRKRDGERCVCTLDEGSVIDGWIMGIFLQEKQWIGLDWTKADGMDRMDRTNRTFTETWNRGPGALTR